jgi:hypothetical protein
MAVTWWPVATSALLTSYPLAYWERLGQSHIDFVNAVRDFLDLSPISQGMRTGRRAAE